MKRWLVVLLVVLALLILISPGLIGHLAERNLAQNVEWVESESTGLEIRTESFERGWFTSEGRHRVQPSSIVFREAAENHRMETGFDQLPSVVIDTAVDHGLVTTSDLTPGLANMTSTFRIDPGNGELVDLPGTLHTKVGLSGASDSRFLMEAGTFESGSNRTAWGGADVHVITDWSEGALFIDGVFEPVTFEIGGDTMRLGKATVKADQVRSDYGFNVGTASLEIESLTVDSMTDPLAMGRLQFAADAALDNERANFGATFAVGGIDIPAVGEIGVDSDLSLNNIDAASMQVIFTAFKNAQNSPDPEQAVAVLFPQIEGDVQKIVAAGAELRVDRLNISLPQGMFESSFHIQVPESDGGQDFQWQSVLLNMVASGDVRIPAALFDFIVMMQPEVNTAVAMGILARDGDDYVMEAEYAQGLVTINGAPMPIPMPGL